MLDLKIDRDKAGLRAHVEEQARKAIQSGVFPRGSRVTKEALGISRTFIREAVRRLQVEGIVSHLAHRGVRIVSVNDYEAEQIDEVRQMPKAIAARDFARRAKDRDVERLCGALGRVRREAAHVDGAALFEAKTESYSIQSEGSCNGVVMRV